MAIVHNHKWHLYSGNENLAFKIRWCDVPGCELVQELRGKFWVNIDIPLRDIAIMRPKR